MYHTQTAFAVHPELAAHLNALRPQLREIVASRPRGDEVVLVVVLSREARNVGDPLSAQFFGALTPTAARHVAASLAPSLGPLLREPPPARCVWCLVLGPRKALVAFPSGP